MHQRIHCGATQDTTEAADELDRIAIDDFLQTLGEVALSVARRRSDSELGEGSIAA